MKRAEREQLIERYLHGRMTPSEEQDFFIEVAADKELRTELKAYQIVESAIRKDRDADTTSYMALRSHMVGVLGGTTIPTEQGVRGAEADKLLPGSAPPSAPGAGIVQPIIGAGTFAAKWAIVAGAVALLATGAAVLWPSAKPAVDQRLPLNTLSDSSASVAPRTYELPPPVPLPSVDTSHVEMATQEIPSNTSSASDAAVRVKAPQLRLKSERKESASGQSADANSTDTKKISRNKSHTDDSLKINVRIDEPRRSE